MKPTLLFLPLCLAALSGCETAGTTTYQTVPASANVTRDASQYGTIVEMRRVAVNDAGSRAAGAVAGGLVGGLIGNQFGGGSGRDIATGVGVIGGAVAGSQIAGTANNRTAQQWIVRLEDGRTIGVIQDTAFRIGQQVRVVRGSNGTRLVG